jgi:transmembrane sensor
MNDRLEHARQLGRGLDAKWQPADVEAQLTRLSDRQRARARRRALAAPMAAAATAAAVILCVHGLGQEPVPERSPDVAMATAQSDREPAALRSGSRAAPPRVSGPAAVEVPAPVPSPSPGVPEGPALAPGVLSLGDGSIVVPLGDDSRLVARHVSDSDVVVSVAGSGARFDVPDSQARRFRAELAGLALETHGAVFRVRVARRQIEVAAERGVVSARGRERVVVAAGETRTFPIGPRDDAAPAGRDEPLPAPEPPTTWREHAARGDYAAAWAGLAGNTAALERMEDLQLAGDIARLSGHAGAAVAPLVRALALHPDDPRAPLAAFTLGRVYLEDLGAPRDAALAFARARELAPDGPLAEDALAREVEAWSRGGETETARSQASRYLRRYPQGRRAHAVRQFGGVEAP